jgi:hypothetical protein
LGELFGFPASHEYQAAVAAFGPSRAAIVALYSQKTKLFLLLHLFRRRLLI